jgi:putative acetyltransferase
MEIREEIAEDFVAIYKVNEAAFGRPDEALLVDRLRESKAIIHSLVAEQNGELVGHALFSPVMIHGDSGVVTVVAGLGPVAVLPAFQKQGIGAALIDAGVDLCREAGYRAMIVLGYPSYYPRFGFQPADCLNISCAYDEVPDDAFMALELEEGALDAVSGVAHYHPEFDGV